MTRDMRIGARRKISVTFNLIDGPIIRHDDGDFTVDKVEAVDYGDRGRVVVSGKTIRSPLWHRSKYYKLYGDKYKYPICPNWLRLLIIEAGYAGRIEGTDHDQP